MEGHGLFRRRRLPHWDLPGATYFVTTCLNGSIPAQGLVDLARCRSRLSRLRPKESLSLADWRMQCWKKAFARCDDWLDRRSAVRHFSDPALAAIVVDACLYWAGRRYDLLAFSVMPSHLHWVFRPIEMPPINNDGRTDDSSSVEQVASLLGPRQAPDRRELKRSGSLRYVSSPRERIMHTLKLHTAKKCNMLLQRNGIFWQDESCDHCVRDDEELERIIQYVELNPVRARLADRPEQWFFSSASYRDRYSLLLGDPIVPSVRQ